MCKGHICGAQLAKAQKKEGGWKGGRFVEGRNKTARIKPERNREALQ